MSTSEQSRVMLSELKASLAEASVLSLAKAEVLLGDLVQKAGADQESARLVHAQMPSLMRQLGSFRRFLAGFGMEFLEAEPFGYTPCGCPAAQQFRAAPGMLA